MGLVHTEIADLVALTQEQLVKRGAFVDLQTDLQDHVLVRELWKGRNKKVFQGGFPWRFDLQIDKSDAAEWVGLYESDSAAFGDTMIHGTVQPRHINTKYIYDLREPDLQRGPEKIVDYVKTKYTAMYVDLFDKLEQTFWGKPADSTDEKTAYGIGYWILKNVTEGFNGENPVGFAAGRANINSTTYTRWSNYGGAYTEVSRADLVRKMQTMARKIRFRSPVSHPEPVLGGMKNGIYANSATVGLVTEFLESQNMNIGYDLGGRNGTFNSTPLTYAPYLDSDTDNPLYFIDWKYIQLGVLAGWENNITKPYMVQGMHNVRRVDMDATMQMICTNLRRQGVLHQA